MSAEVQRIFAWAAGPRCQRDARPFAMALMSRGGSPGSHPPGATAAWCIPNALTGALTSPTPIAASLAGAAKLARCHNSARTAPDPPRALPLQLPPLLLAARAPPLHESLLPAHQPRSQPRQGPAGRCPSPVSASFWSTSRPKDSPSSQKPNSLPGANPSSNTATAASQTPAASPSPSPSPSQTASSPSPPAEVRHPNSAPGPDAKTAAAAMTTAISSSSSSSSSSESHAASEPAPAVPPAASQAPAPVGPGPPPAPAGALLVLHARGGSARASLDRASASLLAAAADLGAKLNLVTGYDTIERLKIKVDEAARRLAEAREQLRDSKAAFEARAAEQGDVQRQQMSLLQRKGSWQAADVERFTALCREEHHLETAVAQTKAAYGEAAEVLEACHDDVAAAVRERYSAETLWSDKIRRASTWWTAGLMGLHLVSFVSVYLVMEPIKARRLRDHVEGVLRLEMANVRRSLASLEASMQLQAAAGPVPLGAAGAMGAAAAAAGSGAGGDGPEDGAQVAHTHLGAELLEQGRQVWAHVAAVETETGLAGVFAQSEASRAVTHTASPPTSAGQSGDAAAQEGGCEGTSRDPAVGSDSAGRTPRARPWHLWLGEQLYRIAAKPEVTTAAAAFVGAALGVGMVLAASRSR